ncbi:Uncharacterised protein [Mycoplasmopsis gallopavonis]|uniref:Uncharacterized protein n=1 Tax=Mycoplasmopsis gallopavonis TaxID=76629 RepID=A0A449AZ27_9BACT|nr:hypothetical protein [Mycoplasmopsis gallopavonis]VEU72760.1 Uncharacterised protein [Mycoplasmopsis gallopavonis]
MKKTSKWILWSSLLIGATTISGMSVFFVPSGIYDTKIAHYKQEEINNKVIDFDNDQVLQNYQNVLQLQDQADINIYFSTFGVQTFYNMIRMSMLANTETHFLWTSKIAIQSNFNEDAYRHFIQNDKKIVKNNQV